MVLAVARWAVLALAAALVAIQFVPYGRSHANPVGRAEPAWDSPQTRALAVRACYDCHSNETTWPWYSNVAPASWLIQRDVDQGRREVNYSEFDRPQREARESAETVQKGSMPLRYYVWLHPDAALTPAERDALVRGLQATFGSERAHESAR
jgi:mono/diheme cytochrome c family protein